jgi:hypothetical protein
MSYFCLGRIGIESLAGQKGRTLTLKAQWLHYVTPTLPLRNTTFRPHSAFMSFVWISAETVIICLYNIQWLIFITVM